MRVEDLATLGPGQDLEADLVIIGAGPAGLTIAREFFNTNVQVLILESGGLAEAPEVEALNAVESVGEPSSPAQAARRQDFHGGNQALSVWTHERQPYGVRCRVFGGSSKAWAGKSASFDATDFEKRSWVPHSGWPITRESMDGVLDRAAERLNLGPNVYDEKFWDLLGAKPPTPHIDPAVLHSFFWQFARSRVDNFDFLRFGPEFLREDAPNIRVLLNATAVDIRVSPAGDLFRSVEISTLAGARSTVRARAAVIAASGIENARLLLASRKDHAAGLGNANDQVGRYLMDHPGARVAHFTGKAVNQIATRFGFYGLMRSGRSHMYMHGLALSREAQERHGVLNGALYMMEDRAPDDPWGALADILRGKSKNFLSDARAVATSPGILAKGIAMKALRSNAVPQAAKDLMANIAIKANPNFVVREFQSRRVPYKLLGLSVDAIAEQNPDPESRITLAAATDPLGTPLARVDWRVGDQARRTLAVLCTTLTEEFAKAGLQPPVPESWVTENALDQAVIIDMAHTVGTTRMSADPREGVVDANCQVHGVSGLFIAGASTFPTSGHVNPTLMIAALAIRLADHLKQQLTSLPAASAARESVTS